LVNHMHYNVSVLWFISCYCCCCCEKRNKPRGISGLLLPSHPPPFSLPFVPISLTFSPSSPFHPYLHSLSNSPSLSFSPLPPPGYERDLKQVALLELEKSKIRGETMHREYEAKRASPVLALNQLEVQCSTAVQCVCVGWLCTSSCLSCVLCSMPLVIPISRWTRLLLQPICLASTYPPSFY
jgi:hypothetical protein